MGRKGNGEGCYRKISKDNDTKELWSGRKQFGYKEDGVTPNIKATYGASEQECKDKMDAYEILYKSQQSILLQSELTKTELTSNDSGIQETLEVYMTNWFTKYHNHDVKEHTYESDEITMTTRILCYPIGQILLTNLNHDNLQKFIDSLCFQPLTNTPYARGTVIKTYNLLNKCLHYAVTHQHLEFNPLVDVVIPKEDKMITKTKETGFLTLAEAEEFYQECLRKDKRGEYVYSRNGLLAIFIVYTGLRIGECLALTWDKYSQTENTISISQEVTRVKNKTGKDKTIAQSKTKYVNKITTPKTKAAIRLIPLSDRAKFVIDEMIRLNGSMETKFIFSTETGNIQSARNINRTLKHIATHVQFLSARISNHVLRHTFGYILLRKGVPISTISRLLGHSKISTTVNIYLNHITAEEARDAIATLN